VFGTPDDNGVCYIGNIFGRTSINGIPVLINAANKLDTTASSKRFKEDIEPMDKSSETLLALKQVTLRYKKEIDPAGTPQLGRVTEDVEKVNPDLVVRDKEGKPYSVRYDQVNAMLLNEFLKQHRNVADIETRVAELTAWIEEEDSQIEQVNEQLQISK
jgi:trimeric autotransporter adhesin